MTILKNKNHFLVALLSACLYIFLAYFLKREQFIPLLIVVAILFGTYAYFINQKTLSSKYLFQFGLIFRSVFLLSTPFLSQDFYRFIWDGRLIMQHVSPFEFAPNSIINTTTISQARQLFDGMGNLSAGHYSNYPPVNQLFFASAALLSSKSILGSIIILRLEIIAADVAIYFIGKNILQRLSLNQNAIFLYFLNPLVIIELSGNLHFEGVMLCFFLCGIYFLIQKKIAAAAMFIALSISTKLLPLMLLPIFFKYLRWQKSALFYIIIIMLNIIFFLPFFSMHLIDHYLNTISLWFVNFEFNASFYYIVKAIGFYFKGYNIIGSVAKITPILLILFIAFVSFYKNNKTTDK
ncbi:MAG: polyprenol phosphomannose-dependent alpha 1,6 mannosyltransferase MptB, partial [Flavobacterium sp.]|nr:polyprenol phosphomannose-dependent alpha 1,6 mannosyltransferase MptB [Flavobacterium sp.]